MLFISSLVARDRGLADKRQRHERDRHKKTLNKLMRVLANAIIESKMIQSTYVRRDS